MKKAKATFSSRASKLRFVLECINSGLYDDRVEYVILGSNPDEIMEEATDPSYERPQDLDALRDFVSDLKTQVGRQYAARRTSLKKALELKQPKSLEQLSPETISALLEQLKNQEEKGTTVSAEQQRDALIEQLDAHYAQEVQIGRASCRERV